VAGKRLGLFEQRIGKCGDQLDQIGLTIDAGSKPNSAASKTASLRMKLAQRAVVAASERELMAILPVRF
jgi:hypothetical protein